MKTKLVLTAIVLFAALMGCSENFNITDPSNQHFEANSQNRPDDGSVNSELVWALAELRVTAGYEFVAENKAGFTNQSASDIGSRYLVTFDVYTNADKFTNGYTPLVQVTKDEDEVLFQIPGSSVDPGDAIGHKEFRIDNSNFRDLKFYIALIQVDNSHPSDDDGTPCVLQLTNIKVSRIY